MLSMIINPIAGSGRAKKTAGEVLAVLAERHIPVHAYYTEYPLHATELARECVRRGDEKVLCIGGDGTAFEVANGLMGSKTALGILPAGTGNDFVRSLGIPKQPIEALDVLLAATPRTINVCQLNERIFLNICGAGFDVEVTVACEKAKRYVTGMLPYLYGVLHTLFTYKPIKLSIELDGQAQEREVLLIAVANGQYIGGGMHMAPMARVDDDLLDVVLIKPVPRWRIPFLLPKFIDGSFIRLTDIVEHTRCRTVRLHQPGMRMQLDGNALDIEDAHISVADKEMWVLMPPAAE